MTKVLLVEDDSLIYRMYSKAFSLAGFETEVAEDGQKGLDKLSIFHPDIILLDIMMPNMNGVEMLAKLKENPATKEIPVIILTNVNDQRTSHEIYEHGAVLTLIKSENDPDQVIGWINSVLAKNSAATTSADHEQPAA
jgi:CheY-like chemotaxis protein